MKLAKRRAAVVAPTPAPQVEVPKTVEPTAPVPPAAPPAPEPAPPPADLPALQIQVDEYRDLAKKLNDREWRLDNLYFIRDETGTKIRFRRNAAQRRYSIDMHSRDLIPKSRKLGFSTFFAIIICDLSVFRSGTECSIVDRTLVDAQDKLGMVKFAYDNLPEAIRAEVTLNTANNSELEFSNGSSVTARTSPRGGTPQFLHISEYGKISVDKPNAAKEIKTGGIQAVPITGKVVIESTTHGRQGEFYEMVEASKARMATGLPLSPLDFKTHFFGWWMKPEYRVPSNMAVLTRELLEYFADLEAKHGIKLDADQRAWYAIKHKELGPDDMRQEFPSCLEECFYASIKGAFWKDEILRARRDKRFGLPLPYDPTRLVNTAWDIGSDGTVIGCFQDDGVRHRMIDYYEDEGGSLQAAARWLQQRMMDRGFVYGKHYFPHDMDDTEWALEKKSRKKIAEALGIRPIEVVPRILHKDDSIEAGRRMLGLLWVDEEHCAKFIERIENYRRRWNQALGVFTSDPVHDTSSHPADMWQQYAMGYNPMPPDKTAKRRSLDQPRKTTSWAA